MKFWKDLEFVISCYVWEVREGLVSDVCPCGDY